MLLGEAQVRGQVLEVGPRAFDSGRTVPHLAQNAFTRLFASLTPALPASSLMPLQIAQKSTFTWSCACLGTYARTFPARWMREPWRAERVKTSSTAPMRPAPPSETTRTQWPHVALAARDRCRVRRYRVGPATKTLVPDPKEATTVQKIFSAYADEHLGATSLANRLNGAGLRNRGDRLWRNQTVLRVLRNPVNVGNISQGDEVYDGKHPSVIDDDLFARAQTLIDERAATVENRAPNTSEYLLTGMLRCRACGGAHFGAGSKGRNGFYRCYACRNRQTKGTYACQSTRVPAEDLETAAVDDLLRTVARSDLFEQAVTAAIAGVTDNRPRLEAELASANAQLRDTDTGLSHSLRAFATGEMPAAICSPRVTELTQRRDELAAHRKEVVR